MNTLLEICCDSFESARRAAEAGADRIELCSDLLVGGTSPSPFLIRQVTQRLFVPVRVLLRPRFGDFCFTQEEKDVLLEEIRCCKNLGVSGIVIGGLMPDGTLDRPFLESCMEAAKGLSVTLHRCFDVCRNPEEALETAVSLGIDTILTSGLAPTAWEGAACLEKLHAQAAGRIHLLAGSGISPENIKAIHSKTGIRHFHMSAKKKEPGPMLFRREGVPMGLPMASEFDRQYPDINAILQARHILDSL